MYHFVRDLQSSKFPEIKALEAEHFKEQLEYVEKYYQFVTIQDCIDALDSEDAEMLPSNAVLLTFDDGYIDHFSTVFPLLKDKGIQGCFFPPAKAVMEHQVLSVNKIHFILASARNIQNLIDEVFKVLDKYRDDYHLESNEYYFSKLAVANRFDPKEIIFFKRLLQVELEEDLRDLIVDELFAKYVSNDEAAFANELYMNSEQLKCMIENGMYVGSHAYNHYWLDSLSPEAQEKEVDFSIQFLEQIGAPIENWAIAYPYGAFNSSLIEILKQKKCRLGFTTEVGIGNLNKNNSYTLERLDTNDLPKIASAEPNEWTKQVL